MRVFKHAQHVLIYSLISPSCQKDPQWKIRRRQNQEENVKHTQRFRKQTTCQKNNQQNHMQQAAQAPVIIFTQISIQALGSLFSQH